MQSILTFRKTRVWSIAAVSAVALSAFGNAVNAAERGVYDAKSYPGSICVAQRAQDVTSVKYNLTGGYEYRDNVIAGRVDVVCPIVRDNLTSSRGLEFVQVHFEDNNRFSDVQCYVSQWDARINEVRQQSSIQKSSATGRGSFRMFLPKSTSNSSTVYTINCKVPGKDNNRTSRITSLQVGERA